MVPGYISTRMAHYKKKSLLYPSPDKFVDCALNSIGSIRSTGTFAQKVYISILLFFEAISQFLAININSKFFYIFQKYKRKKILMHLNKEIDSCEIQVS